MAQDLEHSKSELKVLVFEDSPSDAALIEQYLARGGFLPVIKRIDSIDALTRALQSDVWDLVLSDYELPGFTGLDALAEVRRINGDIPFIILSGVIDQSTAVRAMRMGAQDFVMKGEAARLLPAIRRELRETEVRRQHAEARRRAEALERKLEAEQLVVRELRKIEKIRSEFVEMMTHELRTPVATISSGVDLLLDDTVPGELTTAQIDILQRIQRNAVRLSRLLAGVSDYARLQTGEDAVRPANFALHSVIARVAARMTAKAQERQITLVARPADGLRAYADADAVERVLTHLVANALTHNPPGTSIEINATSGEPGTVAVSVADDGIGLAEDVVEKLFTPFYQVRRKLGAGYQGTGLGLTVCRGLLEQMHGTICVESAPGKGTTFTFMLPKEDPAASAKTAAPAHSNRTTDTDKAGGTHAETHSGCR